MKHVFFTANRSRLMEKVGGLVVLAANGRMQSTNDTFFPFEQEANFWYLTGINEPDWMVICDGQRKSWLVAPDVDPVHQTFDGTLSYDDAKRISGVDDVVSLDDGRTLLRELARKHSVAHTLGDHPQKSHFNFYENPTQRQLFGLLERMFNSVQDCRKDLHRLRAIKQPDEITAIKKAIKLTGDAFTHVKQVLDGLKYEYEVQAEFDYLFARSNARHAYTPIVAAGKNACTLHYVSNDARLKRHQLVLMDVGARVDGYAADITRTYAYGEITQRQAAVHAGVTEARKSIIKLLGPGVSVEEYAREVDEIMKDLLHDLGLLKSRSDDETYRRYFSHAVSHGLGIDVHDSLGGPRTFEAGMVVTVEPGVYIEAENIGVRIEDDILITDNGHRNLSASLSTDC